MTDLALDEAPYDLCGCVQTGVDDFDVDPDCPVHAPTQPPLAIVAMRRALLAEGWDRDASVKAAWACFRAIFQPERSLAPFQRYDNGAPNPAYHEHIAADHLAGAEHAPDDGTMALRTALAQAHATLAAALRTKAAA